MSHKLKFKKGDKVRVIKDIYKYDCSHSLTIGEVYTINHTEKESREGGLARNHQEYLIGDTDGSSWVTESEVKAA